MKIETMAIHAGFEPDPTTKAVAVPIYQTTSYAFDDTQHGADLFDLKVMGNIYTRIMNPTTDVLEKQGGGNGRGGRRTWLGIRYVGHYQRHIYHCRGGRQHRHHLRSLWRYLQPVCPHPAAVGHNSRFADYRDVDAMAALIDDKTKAVFCESIGNPAGNVVDIAALADMAHAHGVPLIIDNTVPSPYLCRPFEYGADIVVHSLTKYMGGHGTTIGGVLVDSGKFPWPSTRSASVVSTNRISPTMVWSIPKLWAKRLTSAGRGWCRCATWVRPSPPSTASRSFRVSKRCM